MMKAKCECDHIGEVPDHRLQEYDAITERPFVNHAPGKCKCTNDLQAYNRNGKILVLCSICCLLGDEPLEMTQ